MWNLIQVKDQTKYKILKTLFQAKEPITIETLSNDTSSSMRSIKNYLVEMKNTAKEFDGFIETSNEGVMLHLPSNTGIDLFERYLLRNSQSFMLLELIFHNDQLNSTELIDKLFLSTSSLSRVIRTLKEVLADYGLSIEANPYRITGEEFLVRKFYSTYFLEAYSVTDWPFSDVSQRLIDRLLDILIDNEEIQTDFMDYHKFRIQFALDIIRSRKGYLVEDPQLDCNILAGSHKEVSNEIHKKILAMDIDSDDSLFYANQLAYWYIHYSTEIFKERRMGVSEFNSRISAEEKVITDLIEIFDLPTFDYTSILMDLDSSLHLYKKLKDRKILKDYILFKPRDYFLIEIFKNSFFFFYEIAEEKMKKLCIDREIEIDDDIIELLMHTILTKWKNLTLDLFERYSTCRILVYSHLNYRHAENIASSLYTNINRVIQIEIYNDTSITKEKLSNYTFDVLVSSTSLSLDIPQKIQYLYYKIHGPFVQPVVHLIDEVVAENKRKIFDHVISMTHE